MSEPFLGEIRIFGITFAPRGWADCDGQILPINQNQSLYSLLGTTYGGDGRTSFALPDLRGRSPRFWDGANPIGQKGGVETVAITDATMPAHNHLMQVNSGAADSDKPGGHFMSKITVDQTFAPAGANEVLMDPTIIGNTGGSQTHQNMQPYIALRFCIALQGLFPSRN